MPRRAPSIRSCGCVVPDGGRCSHMETADRKRKARFDRKRPGARERGYDDEWEKARADWLAAYPSCVRCGQKATVVDHKTPIRLAPHRRLDRTNFQSLCTPCHSSWKQALERN